MSVNIYRDFITVKPIEIYRLHGIGRGVDMPLLSFINHTEYNAYYAGFVDGYAYHKHEHKNHFQYMIQYPEFRPSNVYIYPRRFA